MFELERYGVIARHWHFDEVQKCLHLETDVTTITVPLSEKQVHALLTQMENARLLVGREWTKEGLLIRNTKTLLRRHS